MAEKHDAPPVGEAVRAIRDSGSPRPRFSFVYPHQIRLSPYRWLVRGILPASGVGVLFGPSGCGKSFWGIHISLSVATGSELLGRAVKQAGTIYVAAEDARGIQYRAKAWLRANNVEYSENEPIPFAIVPEAPDLWHADSEDTEMLIDAIQREAAVMREYGAAPGLIVIDTMRDALPGMNENNSEEMSRAVKTLRRIADETGALVLVVHHVPKTGDGEDPRGSSALIGAADVALGVKQDDPEMPPVIWMRKQRGAADEKRDRSLSWGYELNVVELDVWDEDGEPETSCVVRVKQTQQRTNKKTRADTDAGILLDAIRAVLSTDGVQASADVPAPPGVYVAPYLLVRQRAMDTGMCEADAPDATKRTHFDRARKHLLKIGRAGCWKPGPSGYFWLT